MFSVIIPIHNKLPHLERSIDSVLNQTYENFEIILIDDASTDGSSEKLLEFKDERIKMFRRETPGPGGYAARNLGINEAKYEWICFLDADDEWDSSYLHTVKTVIEDNEKVDFITVGWKRVNSLNNDNTLIQKDSLTTNYNLIDYLVNYRYVWTGATSIKKSLIREAGLFPINDCCKRGGDIDTWIRCLNISNLSIYVSKTLAYYFEDSINRVTDYRSNPTTYFCAYDTVINIYNRTNDKDHKKIIENYINKKIYHILSRTNTLDKSLINKMYLNSYSIPRLIYIMCKSLFKGRVN